MKDPSEAVTAFKKKEKEDKQTLHILFEISRMVSSLLHLQDVLDAIVYFLAKEYHFDACAIYLLGDDHLKLTSHTGINGDFLAVSTEKHRLFRDSKECVRTGRIIIANDVDSSDYLSASRPVSEEIKSFAVAPIVAEEKTIGALVTASKKKGYFHKRYSDAIYIIVSQIGIAIRTSQLYDEVVEFSQTLERKVRERTFQLEESHRSLLEAEKHAAFGKMADIISHDCRNSLTIIGGFAKRLVKKMPEDDPNKKYVNIIVDEVGTLEQKVSKITEIKNR
jgi:GAF domain-containing protein